METILVYNQNSKDVYPGEGCMENNNSNIDFTELSKIKNWRKMLSNIYPCTLNINNEEWGSVEHYCIGINLKKKNIKDYYLFKKGCKYDNLNITELRKIFNKYIKSKLEYNEEDLRIAYTNKFDSKINPEFSKILELTKNSTLKYWCNGKKKEEDNILSNVLMKIREKLFTKKIIIKDLVKKEIIDNEKIKLEYNVNNHNTSNMLNIFEKTNIIGIRLEQLAHGSSSNLPKDILKNYSNIKDIVQKEYEMNLIPFIICRKLPNNKKEYWKFEDMIIL